MIKKHPKKMKENQKARKAIFDEHIPKQASTLHKNMTSKCDVRNNDVSVTSRLNKENKKHKDTKGLFYSPFVFLVFVLCCHSPFFISPFFMFSA